MRSAMAVAAMVVGLAPATGPEASPAGVWRTVDERTGRARAVVRIVPSDGALSGRIVQVVAGPGEDPRPTCGRCKGARRGQPVVGMEILWGHRPRGARWSGGRLLDPEDGREYASAVWLEGPDRLRVRGYWGPFHRTQTWRRVPDPSAHDGEEAR